MDEGLPVETDKKAIITPDHASVRGSIVKAGKAGLLAGNLFAALPIPATGQWAYTGKELCVTHSCATARDLHTIPYNSRPSETLSAVMWKFRECGV